DNYAGRKTVVFLPLIHISRKFCDLLNRLGVPAAEVNGNSTELHAVEGFPADDGNFFIEKGVQPGNKLILNADAIIFNLKDENIRIW
ncbi:MAG: hypothetical protein IJP91_08255, partial [Synergistaceae bacterium]|nr:hypothetical protein [Synergistaceae bacterium]